MPTQANFVHRCLFALAIILAIPAAAPAQKNDWLIVPGLRVGPITATTTRAELDTLFGAENVHDGNFEGTDVPEAATLVLAEDPSAGLAVTWDRERPASIHICFGTQTGPCRWRTSSGIRIGLPLTELQKINEKAFQIKGTAPDQVTVVNWRHGQLEEDPAACGHLDVRLAPLARLQDHPLAKPDANMMKSLMTSKPASSNFMPVLELNLVVSELEFQFIGTACAAK